MQYLPIYPEKSWLEVMTEDDPIRQAAYQGDWGENLPTMYYLGNQMVGHYKSGNPAYQYGLAPLETIAYPIAGLFDTAGTIGNTAYNGYKRVYNYGANAYNNIADKYNNWQMQRRMNYTPGNSNTGRKIVEQPIVPTLQQNLPTRPTRYLVGSNGNIVAQIVD